MLRQAHKRSRAASDATRAGRRRLPHAAWLPPLAAALLALGAAAASVPAARSDSAAAASAPAARSDSAAASSALAARPAAAAPAAAELGTGYRLAETWQRAPWSPRPGRYGRTLDLSSTPDGTVFVLDGRLRAVHVADAEGRARSMFAVPAPITGTRQSQWQALRLDAGADGALYALLRGPYVDRNVYRYRVDRLKPDGSLDFSFEITRRTAGDFRDIAVHPDGSIFVSRMGPGSPFVEWPDPEPPPAGFEPNGIDIYRADGVFVETLAVSCMPDHLDFDPQGRLYVANRCPVPLDSPGPPGPTPTTEPSRGPARPAQQAPPMPAQEGVLVFGPDRRFERLVPFLDPEELAAGPAGVFLSRNVEIYALDAPEPRYVGPTDALLGSFMGELVLNLDLPADGRLLAAMNHCYFQGLLRFDRPDARPAEPELIGALDNPELEGPPNPGRVAAGAELALLMERYGSQGARPNPSYYVHPYLAEARTVQRWPLAGAGREGGAGGDPEPGSGAPAPGAAPRLQLGLCGDAARDVAMDGETVYSLEPERLQQRPDDRLPGWSWWPALLAEPDERPLLGAVSADAGRVATLDLGRQRLSLLDAEGQLLADWSLQAGDPGAAPVDLALSGDRIYLADRGRGSLSLRRLDGTRIAAWPTHDGPRAVAAGPEGDAYLLGAGGWAMRYRPDGRLVALWPMPDRNLDARDIAVDAAGRVYVPWARRQPYSGPRGRAMPQYELPEAGVWVFEPVAAPAGPAAERGACLAAPDKRAWPPRLPLGGETQVTLTVEGACPGRPTAAQIMLVLDRSGSMVADAALTRARDFLTEILGQLDPREVELGLVTFDSGAALRLPLGRDIGALRATLAGLEPGGDTRMGAGIDLALAELGGPRGDPRARQILLLVGDGLFKDEPEAAARRALASGVELRALVFSTWDYSEETRRGLLALGLTADQVIVDPMPLDLRPLLADLGGLAPERGLFEQVQVLDRIPANMRYQPDSAEPPARYDPVAHALTWQLPAVSAAAGLRLDYRLEPLECGRWPTNVEASADYLDALGNPGRLVFPVPRVEVVCDPVRIYLPLIDRARCHRRLQPAELLLVLDASSSMAELGPDGRSSKLALARAAADSFLARMQAGDRAALIAFDAQARTLVGLSEDRAALAQGLQRLEPRPGTRIDLGLEAAAAAWRAAPRPGATPVVILLSDGFQDQAAAPSSAVLGQAERLRAEGALLYAIGLGRQVDAELLRRLADSAAHYLASPTAEDLAGVFADISERLACDLP